MVATSLENRGSVTQQIGSATQTGMLVLAVVCLYLVLVALCGLAITVLQLRQQVGPTFDTLAELSRVEKAIEKLDKQIINLSPGLNESAEENQKVAKELARVANERGRLYGQSTLLERRLKELEKDEAKVAASTARVNVIHDFFNSSAASWMARMPSDFVVLLLATLMGALGGALGTLCKLVEEGENPNPSAYLLRPALGFLVAIAVFTLFKAGQLVISSNTSTQTDTLNPFLIGFIGVISGLVANHAVGSVERAGIGFFAAGNERKPVYARELLAQKIEGLSPAEIDMLMSLLKIDPKDLDDWKTETRPIPKQAAEVLSAFFRTNGRDLFFGEPKAGTPKPSTTPAPEQSDAKGQEQAS